MKHILMLTTGGTIACKQTEKGLSPSLVGKDILFEISDLSSICKISVQNLFDIDSTDMTLQHQTQIAQAIWKQYHSFDGFVITHGTDTLSYTAAMLHHLIQNLAKPIILTGSMLPMNSLDSDGPQNLISAFRAACSDCIGVAAVFGNQIISGNHICKVHTHKMDAFRSIGAEPIGTIDQNIVTFHNSFEIPKGDAYLSDIQYPDVLVCKLTPNIHPLYFRSLYNYSKIIIEGYGIGGIPSYLEEELALLIQNGTNIYFKSQCLEGESDLSKYEVGTRAKELGIICLQNHTLENALASIICGEL